MLKSLYGLFEVTESQLTASAIARLKWGSYLSFLMMPAAAAAHFGDLPKGSLISVVNFALLTVGFLGFCLMGFARTFNRLWTPDGYLDESEIARKREVNHFAFFWIMTILFLCFISVLGLSAFDVPAPTILSDSRLPVGLLMAVVFTAMSLQGVKLASLLYPMEAEGSEVERNRVDRYYGLFAVIYVVSVLGLAYIL